MVNEKDAFTAVETDSVDSRRVNVLLQSPNSPSLSGTSSRAAVGGEEEGAAGVAPFEAGQVAPRSNNKCRARIIPARADPKQLALQSTIPRMMAIICLIVSKRQSPRPTHVMGIGYLRLCQVGRRKSGGWKRKGIEKKWKGGGYKRKRGCGGQEMDTKALSTPPSLLILLVVGAVAFRVTKAACRDRENDWQALRRTPRTRLRRLCAVASRVFREPAAW